MNGSIGDLPKGLTINNQYLIEESKTTKNKPQSLMSAHILLFVLIHMRFTF